MIITDSVIKNLNKKIISLIIITCISSLKKRFENK